MTKGRMRNRIMIDIDRALCEQRFDHARGQAYAALTLEVISPGQYVDVSETIDSAEGRIYAIEETEDGRLAA